MNRATATAAPSSVTIKGTKYFLTPLQDLDFGRFEKWLQDRYLDMARRGCHGLDPAQTTEIMSCAIDRANKMAITDDDSIEIQESFEGSVQLAWLSLRHEQPEITEDEVAILLYSPEALSHVMAKIPDGLPDIPPDIAKKKRPVRMANRKKKQTERKRKANRRT